MQAYEPLPPPEEPKPWRCILGFHTFNRSQGAVGYCLREGCDDFRPYVSIGGIWLRYVTPPDPDDDGMMTTPGGLPLRKSRKARITEGEVRRRLIEAALRCALDDYTASDVDAEDLDDRLLTAAKEYVNYRVGPNMMGERV